MGIVRKRSDDPEKRGRIRCFCPEVMGPEDDENHWLDFALPCFTSRRDSSVPDIDDAVWLEFRQGDVRFPIWVGYFPLGANEDQSQLLNVVKGTNDLARPVSAGTLVTVPASEYNTTYPENRVIASRTHVIELDDTNSTERLRIRHKTGSDDEYRSDGSRVVHAVGKLTVHAEGNEEHKVDGSLIIEVLGAKCTIKAALVHLGDDAPPLIPADGVVTGQAIDTFTGATFFVLGNASTKVFAKKV